MAHWIKPSELATKQSIWNASHSIGAGLLALLIGAILGHYGNSSWQWCFWIPAILAIFGSAMIFFGLKNSPASIGLPSVEELDENRQIAPVVQEDPDFAAKAYKVCVKAMVIKNPYIWIISLTNFFVYIIRFTILDWGSSILTQYKHMDIQLAASVVGITEVVGAILGMLVAGWITDKVFKSRAHRTCVVGILGATICLFLFWKAPQSSTVLSITLLVLSSFFIYGPQALLGIACTNQATKRAAATANGISGLFGYFAPIVSGMVFGALADSRGWDAVFLVSVIFGIIGALMMASMWKAPADGYAKAEKILSDLY